MKTLTGIFAATLIIGSFVIAFVGIALMNTRGAPVGFVFISAALALIFGIALDRLSSGKRCPKCAEKVKERASICRYCNHSFTSA
jgi:hypothetical protein